MSGKMRKYLFFAFVSVAIAMFLLSSASAFQLNRTIVSTNIINEKNFSHLAVSDPSIVLYFPFDFIENSENKTFDYTSNNNDGIVVNGAVFNSTGGVYGGYYRFDGTNDYIDAGTIGFSNFTEFSVSFWIRTSSNAGFPLSWSTNRFCRVGFVANKINCAVDGTGSGSAVSTTSVNNGAWHHIVFVSNSSSQVLYFDGVSEGAGSETLNTASGSFYIARAAATYFNGSIDEVIFFNKTLSQSEASQIYNASYPRFYPTGEMNFTDLDLSSQGNINFSFQECQTLNGSYIQGKVNSGSWINFTNCWFNDPSFTGDLENVDFFTRMIPNNNFYSPLLVGQSHNPLTLSNVSLLFASSINLSFPPVNSSPYYDYNDSNYGANSNPTGNPIGGFEDYDRIANFDDAAYYVSTKEDFLEAIYLINSGEIIYINDSAVLEFDKGERINISVSNITIASGRGNNNSKGAILKFGGWIKFEQLDSMNTLIFVNASNVRFTGLRIEGNDESTHWELINAFVNQGRSDLEAGSIASALSSSQGIKVVSSNFEIDNSEIYGWRHAGVYFDSAINGYVHHNYIHHNWRIGLGYGCYVDEGSSVLIEGNLFNNNRHSIASTYDPSSYEARYNINLGERGYHDFDRHGNTGTGGNYTIIHHNSFYHTGALSPFVAFVMINAPPLYENASQIYNNWFQAPSLSNSILTRYTNLSVSSPPGALGTNISIFNNLLNSSGNQYYQNPVAVSSADDYNVSINQVINFDASSSYKTGGSIRYIEWDFGDNSSLEYGESVTHSYSLPGRYLVKTTVSDELGFLNWTYLNIVVNPENASKTYLDFWIFEESFINSPEYVVKRAKINNEVVWEQNFTDNVSLWSHVSIDIPSSLLEGDSVNLSIGAEVLENYTDPLYPNEHEVEFFDIYFDSVSMLRCGEELIGSYDGDFEYSDSVLYLDINGETWTNKTSYERRISGTYSYKVSPVWRGNYSEGEFYGWSLEDIVLNDDCSPLVSSSAINNPVLNPSTAGIIFRPSENVLKNGYSVKIRETQKVEIPVGDSGNKKQIVVESVDGENVIVSVNGEDYEIIGDLGTKIDLDNDGYYDVEITNKKVYSNGVANLEFILIHEEVPAEQEEEQNENILDEIPEIIKKIDWKVYALIGVVIVLIVLFALLNKNVKRKRRHMLFGY